MAATLSFRCPSSLITSLLFVGFFIANLDTTGAQSVGVCYGMSGNNLPPAQEAVSLYKSRNIKHMRLYDPNQAALNALRNSDIQLMLDVPNPELQSLSNPSNANSWVQQNIRNFWPAVRFQYIAVGNEVDPSSGIAQFVLPAIQNVYNAIQSAGLGDQIKVSTSVSFGLVDVSYPPSQGAFRGDVRSYLDPILKFLVNTRTPLLANIYPYFSYAGNAKDISLEYALFTSPSVVVMDNGLGYQNLFDAQLDALYSAIERTGSGSLEVVVSESGWPSAGAFGTSVQNAQTYYSNLINHVSKGTPKRPGKGIQTYLFALFDENTKQPDLEKHFGLFSPDKNPKYSLNFG